MEVRKDTTIRIRQVENTIKTLKARGYDFFAKFMQLYELHLKDLLTQDMKQKLLYRVN